MHVLLTGGYGFIGAWIIKNLLERGDQVGIYDLKEDPHRLDVILSAEQIKQIRFFQGDVTDLPNLRRAVEQQGITHVVHLAGLQVPVCRADPILGAKVNVLGTLAVFEAVTPEPGAGAAAGLRQLGRRLRTAGVVSRPGRSPTTCC